MKKLVLVAIALITVQAFAQEKKREHKRQGLENKTEMHKDFTPEELATLQTKKMTLHLDLTEAQQNKILALNIEQAKLRKAKIDERQKKMENQTDEKPSKEARLKMMNEKLDHQIEMKKKMKVILNAEQFEKWEKMQQKRHAQDGRKQQMRTHSKKQ
ncbi:hypothetical protein A9Q87_06505 [Flavobacteriales bacterium 34_180_T64]|nr:hypothetical protein A9Q87_06505 [Flavobacteriales bacterium 34_180_T64]